MKRLLLIITSVYFCSFNIAASAETSSWTVVELTGKVSIVRPGYFARLVSIGDTFSPGEILKTKYRSQAFLVKGQESLVVQPNSQLILPRAKSNQSQTHFFHRLGTVLFSVEKKGAQHFKVNSRYGAALVKGTTFATNVNTRDFAVQVFEGEVIVAKSDDSSTIDLSAGEKTRVDDKPDNKLRASNTINTDNLDQHFGNNVKALAEAYLPQIEIELPSKSSEDQSSVNSNNANINNASGNNNSSETSTANSSAKSNSNSGESSNNSASNQSNGNSGNNGNGSSNSSASSKSNGNSSNNGNGSSNSNTSSKLNGNSSNNGNGSSNSNASSKSNGNSGNNGNGSSNSNASSKSNGNSSNNDGEASNSSASSKSNGSNSNNGGGASKSNKSSAKGNKKSKK